MKWNIRFRGGALDGTERGPVEQLPARLYESAKVDGVDKTCVYERGKDDHTPIITGFPSNQPMPQEVGVDYDFQGYK